MNSPAKRLHEHLIVMGVAGSGKTTIGKELAVRLNCEYLDGDDLHLPESVGKMRAGIALTDADRWPWLDAIARHLHKAEPMIVGCSALKRRYRDRLRERTGKPVTFVYLHGSESLIAHRLAARSGHFFDPGLNASQFADLEPPEDDERATTVSVDQSVEAVVEQVLMSL